MTSANLELDVFAATLLLPVLITPEATANAWCVEPPRDCVTSEEDRLAGAGEVQTKFNIAGGSVSGEKSSSIRRECPQTFSQATYSCLYDQYTYCLTTNTKEEFRAHLDSKSCSGTPTRAPASAPVPGAGCGPGPAIASANVRIWKGLGSLSVLWDPNARVGAVLDAAANGDSLVLIAPTGALASGGNAAGVLTSGFPAGYEPLASAPAASGRAAASPAEQALGSHVWALPGPQPMVVGVRAAGRKSAVVKVATVSCP